MVKKENIDRIIQVFKDNSTFDFTDYSDKSFGRRIDKILIDENMSTDRLVTRIEKDPKYLNYIKNKITVNTTELFRDHEMWISLYKPLKRNIYEKDSINIWHAGVSSGEELYSMKMFINSIGYNGEANFVGSDISDRILEAAKNGVYKNNIIADYVDNYNIVKDGLAEYENFDNITKYLSIDEKTNMLNMNDELKDNIDFRIINLINTDYNFDQKFDVIMCRNVLIYFNLELQNRIISRFYRLLKPNGILVLGAHESIMPPFSKKFNIIDNIYIKE